MPELRHRRRSYYIDKRKAGQQKKKERKKKKERRGLFVVARTWAAGLDLCLDAISSFLVSDDDGLIIIIVNISLSLLLSL